MRIGMFVYNTYTRDARVLRESSTLARAGHEVTVVAVLDRTTEPAEVRDGVLIVRIDRRPLHYRLLWTVRGSRRRARLAHARARRRPRRVLRRGVRVVARAWRRLESLEARSGDVSPGARLAGAPVLLAVLAVLRAGRALEPLTGAIVRAVDGAGAAGARDAEAGARGRGGVLARAAASAGAVLHRTLMRFHKPLMYLDFYGRAYRRMRDSGCDAFHAHDLNTLPVAWALSRATGARLVYDAHELYPEVSTLSPLERRVWRLVEPRLIRRADTVLTVCDSIADHLAGRYGIARPLVLLNAPSGDGPPVAGAPPPDLRRHAGLDATDEPILLYTGGFAPNRGLPALVRAARGFDRGVLVLMGWGRLEFELAQLVAAEHLGDRVRIVPPVPHDELLAYAAGADIGLIPYEPVGLNNLFSTPNKLFDFLAVGLPIVASRLPEITRIVEGYDVGRVFDAGDPADIARAVNAVLGDPAARARMRANTARARRELSWERQAPKLLAVYPAAGPEAPGRAPEPAAASAS